MPDDLARGRAIWAAKVVAGRRYRAAPPPRASGTVEHAPSEPSEGGDGFRSVGGELQTDETFDREIVTRMGRDFYHQVFQPAIEEAVESGRRYEDIRDSIRKAWK